MRVPTVVALTAALALLMATPSADAADSELVRLISLSRHGSRAPNPTVKAHCPSNKPNLDAYSVPLEQLTERGMQQLEATGRHIRQVYVNEEKFLSPSFNGPEDGEPNFEAYFRADAANRCGQSAISMGYGLYPKGTGPAGFSKQPIPVYMQLWENEHDFTANGPCGSVMYQNNKRYLEGRAAELIEAHKDSLSAIAELCGHDFYAGSDPVTAIKDVNDMFIFDQDEGFDPTPGLTPQLASDIGELAFQHLIERLYSTPTQITTAIGGFPELLVRNLNEGAALSTGPVQATKYLSYHGHRELMHGLGFMMGMKFNFEGLPEYNGSTPLHPGTTLFFELRRQAVGDENAVSTLPSFEYFVRLFVWSPRSERTAVKLDNCEMDCPLQDFTQIIESHIQHTGPWQDICEYHPVNAKKLSLEALDSMPLTLKEENELKASSTRNVEPQEASMLGNMRPWWLALGATGFTALGAIGMATYQRFMRRCGYQSF